MKYVFFGTLFASTALAGNEQNYRNRSYGTVPFSLNAFEYSQANFQGDKYNGFASSMSLGFEQWRLMQFSLIYKNTQYYSEGDRNRQITSRALYGSGGIVLANPAFNIGLNGILGTNWTEIKDIGIQDLVLRQGGIGLTGSYFLTTRVSFQVNIEALKSKYINSTNAGIGFCMWFL